MDERDFELLMTIEKTKNITHAADLLYTSQSAISKRINAIEHELGITLLLRSRNGVHFTPAGESVLYHTKKVTDELALLRQRIKIDKHGVSGTLRAGVSINYALYQLPELLTIFRNKFPYIDTHIITEHSRKIYLQLLDGYFDLAIIRGEFPWKGHKKLIDCDRIYAICSNKDKNKPLNEISFIGRKTDTVFERELSQWMRENNHNPERQGIYVDNISTCVELVDRGLGWTVVPEICLRHFTGHRIPLSFKNGAPFVRSTWLVYTDEITALPQVRAFIETIPTTYRK
ncbi:LysR family transcriptional regulator [Klebsiella quasivariicola]|uniref:Transcriptional regulator n=1 Tax=Klebsiella quasivariicola TaxID=2026240 RepID=A0A8B4U3A2_9ENTR|nr:LysR family transcriptional regulator [Klebsiella quasivariicola]SXE02626.1 transcriptional regulator [Klebsiella quasivariicola]